MNNQTQINSQLETILKSIILTYDKGELSALEELITEAEGLVVGNRMVNLD